MTQTDADADIDWEHPIVIARTVVAMMAELGPWREEKGRMDYTDKDTRDVSSALRFAGLAADAFQMARYLEDSRLWPADERLVKALLTTKAIRANIISQFKQERAPKPPVPEGGLNIPYPNGTYFSDGSTVYKIIESSTIGGSVGYKVTDQQGGRFNIGHSGVKKYLDRHGFPRDSW